jgi:hypothetical protein
VPISHLAGKKEDELLSVMLEERKDLGLLGESDEVGLDRDTLADVMPEKLVLVPGAAAAAFDDQALLAQP